MEPVIQHWLVSVVRAASLEGAADLDVPSDTEAAAAWDVVALGTGTTESQLAGIVARHYRLGVAELGGTDPHAHKLLSGRVARKLGVLPLQYSDRQLWVATSDPVSLEAEKQITQVSSRSVQFEVAPPRPLRRAIEATYGEEEIHEIPPLEVAARGGPRVLVVDDDEDTRLLLHSFLEDAGFRVREAADGKEALRLLEEREDPFTLITLDLDMPGLSGLEVLRKIRSRVATASIPVVVATGLDDPEVELELFEAGADDFVVKPVDPPRFLLRVQAVLRRQGPGLLDLLK